MKWRILGLLGVVSLLMVACGGAAKPDPTCGADVCITDIRLVNPDAATLTLIFELTEPDGSLDPAAPPQFQGALQIRLNSLDGGAQYIQQGFTPDELTCLVGDTVPGAEGRTVGACLASLSYSDFVRPATPGEEVLLTVYSDVFPIMLTHVNLP